MKFSYHWLKELVSFKESPQELAEFLTMRVFEVEGVEKAGNDWVLDVAGKTIGPRIADASGHLGMAREIGALKGLKVKSLKFNITEDAHQRTQEALAVKVESPEDCPRYTARVVTGVSVASSPAWVQERLRACGVQAVNNVVDAANYVMLETGQPLHVFDWDKLSGAAGDKKSIIVRRARRGEVMPALDGKTYALNPDVLVIADERNPIAIAGIKGGQSSGVSDGTHTVIIEAANFNPGIIRRASRTLALRTDASVRFEHGLDPEQTRAAADRLARLIQDIAGGEILGGVSDVYPVKNRPVRILFRPAYAERLLGSAIPAAFYPSAFRRLGWRAIKKGAGFLVTPPTARRDIEREEDIVEEIGRLLGYENVNAVMPRAPLLAPLANEDAWWEERVRDYASRLGFYESVLSRFIGDRELGMFRMKKDGLLELQNPANPDAKYLVPRALITYAASVAENLRHTDEVRIFGVGRSFQKGAGGMVPGVRERRDIVLALARKGADGEDEFYELKGALDEMLENLGISDHWYDDVAERDDAADPLFHAYRHAEIKVGDETIGRIGEIHPAVIERLKARARITAAELLLDRVVALAEYQTAYRPVGKYPAIVRDIAVVVPGDARADDVLNIIENTAGPLLEDTELFDYFQDEGMREEGTKSIAFHLIFQSPERTLTDAEVETIIAKVIAALEAEDWEVKK